MEFSTQTPKLFKGLKFVLGLAAFAFVLLLTSCGDDDDNDNGMDMPNDLSTVATEEGLTTLIAATDALQLTAVLEAESAITVFAPDNDAFAALLDTLNITTGLTGLVELLGESRVSDILQYHVVASSEFAEDLTDGRTLPTLAGQDLVVRRENGAVFIEDESGNRFEVTEPDVPIANGVVHVIEGVLLSTPTVADVAVANDLNVLLEALTITGLDATLLGANDITVFAPTDAAFTTLLGNIGQSSLDSIPVDVLTRVLRYHVLASSEFAADLSNEPEATLLSTDNVTDEIMVNVNGSTVTINNSAQVTTADQTIRNGVVHVINQVLVPALETSIVNTVVAPAYFNIKFSTLSTAVQEAGLVGTLISSTENGYTLFAPTDDAFTALLNDLGISAADLLAREDLDDILLYHVLDFEADEAAVANLGTGSAVPSLGGDSYLSINDEGIFLNGTTKVVQTDIQATNGVIHVIDRALLPPSNNIVQIAIAASQGSPAEFGQLVAALTRVSNAQPAGSTLIDILESSTIEDGAPFTVFAPTDAAFQALYDALDGVTGIDDIEVATLEAVLTYHVVSGARVFSTDIPNLSNPVVTLGGDFELNGLVITYDDQELNATTNDTANIIASSTNILGTNGVIHAVDRVLLP